MVVELYNLHSKRAIKDVIVCVWQLFSGSSNLAGKPLFWQTLFDHLLIMIQHIVLSWGRIGSIIIRGNEETRMLLYWILLLNLASYYVDDFMEVSAPLIFYMCELSCCRVRYTDWSLIHWLLCIGHWPYLWDLHGPSPYYFSQVKKMLKKTACFEAELLADLI